MKTFLDEQFSELEQELKMTNKSKSLLRNKVLQNTVIIKKRDLKNNRVWQYNTITVILIATVIIFLATQSLDTLRHTTNKVSYGNEIFEPSEVKMKDKVVVQDYIEFTIQSNELGEIIYPSNLGVAPITPMYMFNGNKGEIWLDILVTVRNTSSTELSEAGDFMDIKIIYDDREEFSSFTRFERVGESKFTSLNNSIIKPLQTRVVHFLTSVPASIEKDGKPLKAIITANGENYEYVIR
ncbi:hypothetical protein KD050_00205 [Psychrobacillus sp. INOP01]|uniref:hypothetical protein n=1 Tax=Psychrobacillus sp. INOP01 TaxID=2829187 RepID=UPI001BAA4060|nr:hypothetical protein [Psychrobacillus sp. INOP01]QUG41765.1 hypothetical protein KD050_00205 [Psychrobacillus sp. INOP01]